jgi:hypothetical protein
MLAHPAGKRYFQKKKSKGKKTGRVKTLDSRVNELKLMFDLSIDLFDTRFISRSILQTDRQTRERRER